MTGEVTYETLLATSQANLWTLLRNDSVIASLTKNVLDGIPKGLTSGTGFPYVIVPTPTIPDEVPFAFGGVISETILFRIDVFDRKESVLRQLCDRIRYLVRSNETVFKNSYGMYRILTSDTSMTYATLEDETIIYNYTINLVYKWWGT